MYECSEGATKGLRVYKIRSGLHGVCVKVFYTLLLLDSLTSINSLEKSRQSL